MLPVNPRAASRGRGDRALGARLRTLTAPAPLPPPYVTGGHRHWPAGTGRAARVSGRGCACAVSAPRPPPPPSPPPGQAAAAAAAGPRGAFSTRSPGPPRPDSKAGWAAAPYAAGGRAGGGRGERARPWRGGAGPPRVGRGRPSSEARSAPGPPRACSSLPAPRSRGRLPSSAPSRGHVVRLARPRPPLAPWGTSRRPRPPPAPLAPQAGPCPGASRAVVPSEGRACRFSHPSPSPPGWGSRGTSGCCFWKWQRKQLSVSSFGDSKLCSGSGYWGGNDTVWGVKALQPSPSLPCNACAVLLWFGSRFACGVTLPVCSRIFIS